MSALIALMMEAARTSETLVNFYQTTRRYTPDDRHLQQFTVLNEAVEQAKYLQMKHRPSHIFGVNVSE
jgi:hypothetical protein